MASSSPLIALSEKKLSISTVVKPRILSPLLKIASEGSSGYSKLIKSVSNLPPRFSLVSKAVVLIGSFRCLGKALLLLL